MQWTRLVVPVVLLLAAACPGSAVVLSVPGSYPTIQAAITAAVNGDTIEVAAGVYAEKLTITNKSLTLLGAPGATIAPTVSGNTITIRAHDVTISGFTIKGTTAAGTKYGILVFAPTGQPFAYNVIVENCDIGFCSPGGAIYLEDSVRDMTIRRNRFHDSQGGVWFKAQNLQVYENSFEGCGVISMSNANITGNLIQRNNFSWWGDGVLDYGNGTYPVFAPDNYWGSASGPDAPGNSNWPGATINSAVVSYTPWLGQPYGANALWFAVPPESLYVRPGDTCTAYLNQSGLAEPVAGYQAFLSFDTARLNIASAGISLATAPYGLPIRKVVSGANIDLAAGINRATGQTPISADAQLAEFTFTVPAGALSGYTYVNFRANDPATMFSNDLGDAVATTAIRSPRIYIDGNNPIIGSFTATPSTWTKQDTVALKWSITDPTSGVEHVELQLDDGPWTTVATYPQPTYSYTNSSSPYSFSVASIPDGPHTLTLKLFDRAGNFTTATATIQLDKMAPVLTIPDDYTTTSATVSISASAVDAHSGLLSLTMDGSPFTSPTTVTLVPGENTFTFVATDNADNGGNVATDTLTITYQQPAPSIQVFRSLAPNKYGSSSWAPWLANAVAGARDNTSPVGDTEYNTFADFGTAIQDFATAMVSSSNSWKGVVGGTELGTAVHPVWRLDNGVKTNPGAAKLDVTKISIVFKDYWLGADGAADNLVTDYSSWWNASAATASFGGTSGFKSALKGFDWDGTQWVEVTSGTQADLIIYGWFRYAHEPEGNPPPTQPILNNLYKQMAGSVAFTGDPRRTLDKIELEVLYNQPFIDAGSSGVVVTSFDTDDDAAPVVDVTAPADGFETNDADVTITGTATDNAVLDSGIREVKITLNGSQVYLNTTQDNVSFAQAVTLAEGTNTIVVTATDFAGNDTTATRTVLLDTVNPVISIDSATQSGGSNLIPAGTAVQGTVDITVTASDASSGLTGRPAVTVTDALGAPMTVHDNGGSGGTFLYYVDVTATTANGLATINATVSDEAGNSQAADPKTFNVNKSQVGITVELEGVHVATTRTIKFAVGGTGGTAVPFVFSRAIGFTWDGDPLHNAVGSVVVTDLPNNGMWTHISAKDEQHTLRQTIALSGGVNKQWAASFTTGDMLYGGDLTNDNLVDIRDFGVFAGQYGQSLSMSTVWPVRNANIDCFDSVNTPDFSFIQINFLDRGDDLVGNAMGVTSILLKSVTVAEMAAITDFRSAKRADLNNSGEVDNADVKLFIQKYLKVKRGP